MPRRRFDGYDDDDFDDPPRPRRLDYRDDRADKKPGLATAAAVLWLVWAGLLLLAFLVRGAVLVGAVAADADVNPVCGGVGLLLVLVSAAWAGVAGLLTVLGKSRSLTAFGVLSLVLPPAVVLMETAVAFFIGIEAGRDLGPRGRNDLPFVLAFRSFLFNSLLASGVVLAGIFALCANKRYREWSARR